MVKLLSIIAAGLLLASCSSAGLEKLRPLSEPAEAMEPAVTKKRYNELVNLRPPAGPVIPIAVYKFTDLTGQRKTADFASLSTAVTQGSEVFLIKALQDAGRGSWFKVVERVGIDNLVKERQLIRSQRETYEGETAQQLPPLVVAGVMVEGGIVGYDSNITTGGVGARVLGIGADKMYRRDEVTVILRLVSISTGEVLLSSGVTKSVLSTSTDGNMLKFVDQGTVSVEFESGYSINEPTTYAVRIAIEQAVAEMVKEGVKRDLWKFKNKDSTKTSSLPGVK